MDPITIKKSSLWWGLILGLVAGFLLGFFTYSLIIPPASSSPTSVLAAQKDKSVEGMRAEFLALKEAIITKMKDKGQYRCCLKKLCIYCIEADNHGDKATCECLNEVMKGKHPCGECIGEILEGHGDPNFAKYFAKSIAHEVGEKYIETLKQIISDKYKISIDEQK